MIGIVVVSHSRALAEAAVALAQQMAGDDPPPIEVAAGTPDGGFGTDATAIAAAIDRLAASGDVLVLMDLGSAILSAELALEFVESPERVRLSAAPFVEGLVAAVVLAASGAALTAVADELDGSVEAKQRHLEAAAPAAPPPADPVPRASAGSDAESFETVLVNPSGLHARPAATFVKAAGRFDAEVSVENLDAASAPVSAASLLALIALGVGHGARVRVSARGPEAHRALTELRALIETGFGET